MYAEAAAKARQLGKPLLVIGAPDGGVTAGYGCGDVTIDLQESSCPVSIKADITKTLPFDDNSAVVFVSCVLEYVNDAEAAMRELRRVAGPNLYMVRVEPWTLTAYLYPGAQRTFPRNVTPESEAAVLKLRPSGHALLRRHNETLAPSREGPTAIVRTGAVADPSAPAPGFNWMLALGALGAIGVALYIVKKSGEKVEVTHRQASYEDLWSDATRATRDPQRAKKQKSRLEAWEARKAMSAIARRENEW
jgi:SAM-dependent methyltransferase